jgi:hypothetical protein
MEVTAQSPSSSTASSTDIAWPGNPYKGLSFYTSVDSGLFGGREADVRACARIIGEEQTKVMLLHGTTGCGKSSFLRAGLIPYLESSVGRFQFLRSYDAKDTKALFIRCTEAPLDRLCETLYDWTDTPFRVDLPDDEPEKISLEPIRGAARSREEFVENNAKSVQNLIGILRLLGKLLPRTIVLVIDQGEEVLTLNRRDDNPNSRRFFDFLIAFSKSSIDLKVIVALRKEYFGDFYPELDGRHYDREKLRAFQLHELFDKQLVEAIEMPASRNVGAKYLQGRKQPGEHYNFEFESGLPVRIVSDLRKIKASGGVLPVLQITCERLYRATKSRGEKGLLTFGSRPWHITHSDYQRLGPLDTQIQQYIDESILDGIAQQLPDMTGVKLAEERDRWKDVLHWMVHKQSDNTALSRICSGKELSDKAVEKRCRAKFAIEEAPEKDMATFLSSEDRRILRKDPRGKSGTQSSFAIIAGPPPADKTIPSRNKEKKEKDPDYFSLGHDAMAVELDTWGATRTVLLRRRDYFKVVMQGMTKVFALYFAGAGILPVYLVYSSEDKFGKDWFWVFTLAVILLCFAASLWVFSEKIARRAVDSLIRSPLFRNLLTNPPVQ